uniref:Uncharacterized protein n=1 Tax=Oryza glaberrima TaxID=4538 RepID=I1R6D0_ORYGL
VILGMTARKRVRRRCTWATTMGTVHKEVRGGTNHAHIIKEELTRLPKKCHLVIRLTRKFS